MQAGEANLGILIVDLVLQSCVNYGIVIFSSGKREYFMPGIIIQNIG